MTSKPYQTTAQQPTQSAHNAPETYTVKRMKALGLWTLAVCVLVVGWWLADVTGWLPVALVAMVIAVALIVAGCFLWEYSNRAIGRDLPKQQRAKRTGDVWRIHLKREIPVGNRGAVDMEPDPVDLPVAPSQFVNIVRQMKRTGTSRNKRPAGVSQPLWAKIMATLEDLDGAHKGPNGYELADDLDALLSDIERW